MQKDSFEVRKQNWVKNGGSVCRHGVFWKLPRLSGCTCMQSKAAWEDACYMPYLDLEPKAFTVLGKFVLRYDAAAGDSMGYTVVA